MLSRKLERKSFLVVAITVLVHRRIFFLLQGIEQPTLSLKPPISVGTEIGDAAEQYRHDLAIEWIGQPP